MAHLVQIVCGFLMYVAPASIAVGCLAMLLRFERRIGAFEADLAAAKKNFQSQSETVTKNLAAIREMAASEGSALPQISPGPGANAAVRARILKMHRLGGSVDQIATALAVSKAEVALLLKVHNVVMQAIEQPNTLVEEKV
jgi:hypothetical protein